MISSEKNTTVGASWTISPNFTNLDDLWIQYYSSGQSNLQILPSGLPASAFSDSPPRSRKVDRRAIEPRAPAPSASANGSVVQIFYPAHSYSPSSDPVGGTQFYALTPFSLPLARSVTFNYSVFFPEYYNFVLSGKLPGMYGGAEGCGGGNSAEDCWSTRMAWRANGTGELYV